MVLIKISLNVVWKTAKHTILGMKKYQPLLDEKNLPPPTTINFEPSPLHD